MKFPVRINFQVQNVYGMFNIIFNHDSSPDFFCIFIMCVLVVSNLLFYFAYEKP